MNKNVAYVKIFGRNNKVLITELGRQTTVNIRGLMRLQSQVLHAYHGVGVTAVATTVNR